MRWKNVERAPEFEKALRAVGLPVVQCERQTHPPHWVRTSYERRLSCDEQELANRTKAALKAGKFDPAKERRWFDRKSQANPCHEPATASRQRVPEVEEAFRLLGFPVDLVERNTTGPLRLYATFTRDLSEDERIEFNEQRVKIRQRLLDGKPLIEPAQKPPPQFPAPAVIDYAPGVPVKRQTEPDPHEAIALRIIGIEVIRQAWADAFSGKGNGTDKDRTEARNFLTSTTGDWVKARELWCAIADHCPDWLRDQAMKRT